MLSPKKRPPPTNDWNRDYILIAKEYAKWAADIESSGQYIGRWVRLAAQRFLRDLKRAASPDCPFYFDPWNASNPCDFIEKLPHVEGKWKDEDGNESPNIILHASDCFFLVQLFGFRMRDTGGRRFTTAVKVVGRKNAKSTIAAGIGLYCQACEDEVGPQIISVATTGSQARIIFNIAKRMVEKTEDLREQFLMEAFANAIASYGNGGSFKPINAKASTQDGLNPSVSLIDEIHAHKNHDLMNVIQSAAGARESSLFLFTTTEGYDGPGPWPELRHFLKQVLLEIIEADHFLGVYYAVDEDDEKAGIKKDGDFDEEAWYKANPLLDCNPILLREIRKAAIDAKAMPGKLAEFRIKRLNRIASAPNNWISYSHWKACVGGVDLKRLEAYPCWGGLDLASTTDLVSFRLVWLVEGVLYTWGRRWVPAQAIAQRTERGTVPYLVWMETNQIEQTEGEVTDYSVVKKAVLEACARFNVQEIGYDPWNATQVVKELKEEGVRMKMFIQGTKSYHPAMAYFETMYLAGNFRYGDDPVLTWCASNIVVRNDANMNKAPDRKKSFEKIDDMVALLEAVGTMIAEQPEKPKEPTLMFVG